MAQISSTIGLASGINIGALVQSLTALTSERVSNLQQQNTTLTTKSTDLTQLEALLTSLQDATNSLGESSLYSTRKATSSNSTALGVTVTGSPAAGTYQFTPIQAAQTQQVLSSQFSSESTAIGEGTITFRQGANLNQTMSLADLNGGAGVPQGEIEITDHAGASAVIDLSSAQTIGDVLNTINSNTTINVTAVANGDGIELIDNSSGSTKLSVQEVDGGTTAAALGLAGIDTSSSTATGQSVVELGDNLSLSALNDGNGLSLNNGLGDISYTLHNGDTGTIDIATILANSSTVQNPTTLGEVLDELNAAHEGLTFSISADGTSLQAVDSTEGGDAFTLSDVTGSHAVEDLGLTGSEDNGTISGSRIIAGTQGVLLSQLNGGQGLGTLGTLNLTDRAGNTASVDLSGASTIQDVINDINAAVDTSNGKKLGITAEVDSSGLGVELVDTTGKTASSLIVANSDSTDTATKLGIDLNDSGTSGSTSNTSATSVDSGNLHQQIISNNTLLSSLNGGNGVADGSFTIVDTAGKSATVTVSSSMQTVDDLLNAINSLSINQSSPQVTAKINATGDGIELVDTAGGTGQLQVEEGSSTTAADLNLLSGATTTQTTIDGSTTYSVAVSSTDTLSTLVSNINALDAGVQASIFNDGSNNPYRLMLTSQQSGAAGNWNIAVSGVNMSLQQISTGQDAQLLVGDSGSSASSILVASPTGQFTSVLPGATIQVNQATGQPVTVSVTNSDSSIATAINTMVSDYNQFQQQLSSLTNFDTTTETGSALTGDYSAIEMQTQLQSMLSGTFANSGSIQSLAQLGVTMNSDGTLSFDQSVLDSAYTSDPNSVQQFFTNQTTGLSAQFNQLITQLAGTGNSLLNDELESLQNSLSANNTSITQMNTELTDQENQLYTEFYNMEVAIASMQNNMSILEAMGMTASTSSSSGSGSSSSGSSSSSSGSSSSLDSNIGNSSSSTGSTSTT